jgi:DNA-binding PadR family transcriptional regulator
MLSTRTALLQALRQAPGYGKQLIRRLRGMTGDRIRLTEGSVYPALQALERGGLVRSWTVVPGRRRGGRARRYYEVTARGIKVAARERESLSRLVGGPLSARDDRVPPDAHRMMERIRLGAELSETALRLADRMARARASRGAR